MGDKYYPILVPSAGKSCGNRKGPAGGLTIRAEQSPSVKCLIEISGRPWNACFHSEALLTLLISP